MLNLTQHQATPIQVSLGVVDLPLSVREEELKPLLDFMALPGSSLIKARAKAIAELAAKHIQASDSTAMIGGAPFLMPSLERALLSVGITPFYAFSVREVQEKESPDGSRIKTSVFSHLGFVEAVQENSCSQRSIIKEFSNAFGVPC